MRRFIRTVPFFLLAASCSFACSKNEVSEPAPQIRDSSSAHRTEPLKIGAVAPLFQATAHSGEHVQLEDLRGKAVILYFYPKDGTPGCTIEAQEFASHHSALVDARAVVLGVSTDDNSSHRAFAQEHDLPFLLLADTDRTIARAYGVGSILGKSKRFTYLIDPQGKIAQVYPDVDPKTHAEQVLADLAALKFVDSPAL